MGSDNDHPVRSTGGNNSVKLNVDNMPSHSHGVSINGELRTNRVELIGGFSSSIRPNGNLDVAKWRNGTGIVSKDSEYHIYAKSGEPSQPGRNFKIDASHSHTLDQSSFSATATSVGGNKQFDITNKYFVVNMWERVE